MDRVIYLAMNSYSQMSRGEFLQNHVLLLFTDLTDYKTQIVSGSSDNDFGLLLLF